MALYTQAIIHPDMNIGEVLPPLIESITRNARLVPDEEGIVIKVDNHALFSHDLVTITFTVEEK